MDNLTNPAILQVLTSTVDVVIPFHKVDNYLFESIKSVKASQGVKIRIIAVNDTQQEVTSIQIGLTYQDILVKSEVTGYLGALATGVSTCSSEFIAFQDSDDTSDPERFFKQIAFLRDNNCDLVIGKLIKTDMFGKTMKNVSVFGEISDLFPLKLKFVLGPHGADSSILGKRLKIQEQWTSHANFTPSFSDYGWLLMHKDSFKIGYCKDALYFYRSHSGQMSRKTSDVTGWLGIFPVWLENFRSTFSEVMFEKDKIIAQLTSHPLVGLCIAFPSSTPKLTKSDRYVLKAVIEWIMKQSIIQNSEQMSLLKETLYRRGFIGTRGRSLKFWPAGLRMFSTMLSANSKGIKPRWNK